MPPDAITENDPSVSTHLLILQGIIDRFASNSASCKTWCVTLVAAMFVLAFTKEIDLSPLVALIPIGVLAYQDVTYLTLERDVRSSYNGFVGKLRAGNAVVSDLFSVAPTAPSGERFKTARSWSVSLFYLPLAAAAIGLHFV